MKTEAMFNVRIFRRFTIGLFLALLGISSIPRGAEACTGGALTAADGSVVVGRTLEFGQPLDSQIAIWPAGSSLSGSSTSGAPLRYRSRYGFVGASAAGSSIVIEPRGGRLVVHDNPTRVLTNAPTLDWHITNLNNSVTLMQAYPAPN